MFINKAPIITWGGIAWRSHNQKYPATDPGGSLRISGRYNQGLDKFPQTETWPALYLGLTYGVCIGEVLRHAKPETLRALKNHVLSRISVNLMSVLDCRDLDSLGIRSEQLFHDTDYSLGQELAFLARGRNCEAIMVGSATGLPDDNLIVFTDRLSPDSELTHLDSISANLITF